MGQIHFDLYICPEEVGAVLSVSLWAIRGLSLRQRIYVAPAARWLEYSRGLERANLLDARSLGIADACVARGETMVHPVQCSPHDLEILGFREAQPMCSKRKEVSFVPDLQRVLSSVPPAAQRGIPSPDGHVCETFEQRRILSSTERVTRDQRIGAAPRSSHAESSLTKAPVLDRNDTERQPPACIVSNEERVTKTLSRSQIALLGVRIHNVSMDETIETIDQFIEQGGFHQVATANVDFLTKAFEDSALSDILNSCDLVVADGMPLVWASQLMGVPLKERVTGSDLLPKLLELSARKNRKIFLLGATEERSRAAVQRIEIEYPGVVICGRHSPEFAPIEEMANEAILREIQQANPDLLIVAFGNPKQEKWISTHRNLLKVPVCIGVGASIDFLSGKQSRAPLWMQRSGLEWIHRLLGDPRRLASRYLSNGIFLLRYLSVQLLATSLQPRGPIESQLSLSWRGDVLVAEVVGAFSGSAVDDFLQELEAYSYRDSLILDLSSTTNITPDAAGLIVHLAHRCTQAGSELWVAAGRPSILSAFRATFPGGEPFQIAMTVQDALRFLSAGSSSSPDSN